jgi:hypothetical protein
MGEVADLCRMAASRSNPALRGPLGAAIASVAEALSRLPARGMLIGGIAVIARGVARTTRDVDATVSSDGVRLEEMLPVFEEQGLRPRIDDALGFAQVNQVLLLRHEASGVDVDVSIAWLPFELDAIRASDSLELAGVDVPVARAEDLVIYKSVAWRPQDQQDVERLLTLHGRGMDLARVTRIVAELAAAIDEPERSKALEEIIRRAMA